MVRGLTYSFDCRTRRLTRYARRLERLRTPLVSVAEAELLLNIKVIQITADYSSIKTIAKDRVQALAPTQNVHTVPQDKRHKSLSNPIVLCSLPILSSVWLTQNVVSRNFPVDDPNCQPYTTGNTRLNLGYSPL